MIFCNPSKNLYYENLHSNYNKDVLMASLKATAFLFSPWFGLTGKTPRWSCAHTLQPLLIKVLTHDFTEVMQHTTSSDDKTNSLNIKAQPPCNASKPIL